MPAKQLSQLNADEFRQAIGYFKEFLTKYEQLINDLNVYPVPDSDTGTNSLVTLSAGISQMSGTSCAQLARTLSQSCAKAALGNSGVILAAYLSGIADVLNSDQPELSEHANPVTLTDWQNALTSAAANSHQAVLRPSQGTMLTIADAVAASKEEEFSSQLVANSTSARLALVKTTEMLPSLAEAGVVDSGAVVLTLFHDAFAKLMNPEGFTQLQIETTECKVKPDYQGPSHELMFGINLATQEKDQFVVQLEKSGDSISITPIDSAAPNIENLRIHIHCDDPDRVINQAKTFGEVSDLVLFNLTLKNL